MRTKAALPFHIPNMVWKKILGHPVSVRDLKFIDKFLVDYLENIARAPRNPNMSAELFNEQYGDRHFTTSSIDGREIELKPGGRNEMVTLANSSEFVQLMYAYHLAEFDVQCAAIARGLATQVPINVLRMFTWSQCELLVTGRNEVDLRLLREMTTYDPPFSANNPTIKLFWEMMEGFTQVRPWVCVCVCVCECVWGVCVGGGGGGECVRVGGWVGVCVVKEFVCSKGI